MRILVINGPNINMLGIREKNIYGVNDYNSLVEKIKKEASELDCQVDFFQSNIEGEIITSIQKALGVYDGIIINPAAYTHYSIGILDALKSVNIPAIEVHISNIHQREDFRKKSVTAEGCIGQISGLGFEGYTLALRGLVNLLK
ncbi:type II 3-dehydroquinate dehydratase [uncultured Fusobacterium sp.]|uniref:type II 3-dehydroquinate dehydratase n=1 Tax=uncultured Fusobacterium sp. TaxID=159267 RepID=UPI0015A53EE8|nr:type II 3-dehydroquinate dehydratase [uncultured Fusobacterium sp.]